MKKIFVFILLAFCSITSRAQEADSIKIRNLQTIVDSISNKLTWIQRDFDYLKCEYTLVKFEHEVENFCQDCNINTNNISSQQRFNNSLYNAIVSNYDVYVEKYNIDKEYFEKLKLYVLALMETHDFTDNECNILNGYLSKVNIGFSLAERALECYRLAIESYRLKRFNL